MFNGDMPDQFQAIRPILGTLLFEHENSFCEALNGLLWYLPAILFMHITIDTMQKDQISEIQFFPCALFLPICKLIKNKFLCIF